MTCSRVLNYAYASWTHVLSFGWIIDKDEEKGFGDWDSQNRRDNQHFVSPSSHQTSTNGWMKRKTLLNEKTWNHFPLILFVSPMPPPECPENDAMNDEVQARIKQLGWRWQKISPSRACVASDRIEEITFVSFFCAWIFHSISTIH